MTPPIQGPHQKRRHQEKLAQVRRWAKKRHHDEQRDRKLDRLERAIEKRKGEA